MKTGVRHKLEKDSIESFNFTGKGIYVLFNTYKDIVYIGKSDDSLERALLAHLEMEEKIDARYFIAWPDENPEIRFKMFLDAYKTAFFGRLPDCTI